MLASTLSNITRLLVIGGEPPPLAVLCDPTCTISERHRPAFVASTQSTRRGSASRDRGRPEVAAVNNWVYLHIHHA